MFVINRFADAMLSCLLCGWFAEGLNPSRFYTKVIVKLKVISDDGRQAAVAEMRRADKFEDKVKEGVTSFRGRFEESVTI